MVPLTGISSKAEAGYQLSNEEGKTNHLMFLDDLKLYGKDETEGNDIY